MEEKKVKILVVRFPYRNENPELVDWLVKTVGELKAHPRVEAVLHWRQADTPIPMCRNMAVQVAKLHKADYLLMLDDDVSPDLPGELPFFPRSLDFALQHDGPCIIAAPYCGPPPINNVFVFRWTNLMNDPPDNGLRLTQYPREEAVLWKGIVEVAALPTGVMLIDMRTFEHMKPPYFYYEYTDEFQCEKASTEDVTFTRDASLNGVRCYCNWDSWSGHWKGYRVPKPRPIYLDEVRQTFVDAVQGGMKSTSVLQEIMMRDGRPMQTPGNNPAAFEAAAKQFQGAAPQNEIETRPVPEPGG